MATAAEFVKKAAEEVGTVEEGDNLTKYGKFTKHDGQPWCGSFCMWVAAKVGLKIPDVVYTPAGVERFKGIGAWSNVETSTPKQGDIVFFDFVKGGAAVEHVGIVVKDNGDGTVITIEGNTSPDHKPAGSQANGGEVAKKVRAFKKDNKRGLPVFIVGFGTPKFN
jgi:hypothetical protein